MENKGKVWKASHIMPTAASGSEDKNIKLHWFSN